MKLKTISTMIAAIAISSHLHAAEVGGHNIPDSLKTTSSELALNGAGMREKWLIDLYVGGLYLKEKQQNAEKILDADEPMALRLQIVSGMITSEKMTSATVEGFESALNGKTEPLQAKIDDFLKTFKDEIKEGDVFEMVYDPKEGVKIYKNTQHANTIQGLEFKKALFGIWLSDNPAQKSLKKQMLGTKG